ncbi:single-stranded DNA-binding protein [Candidatus Dojkabacteria bacterium]|nr:single-stranded DNA-binding protein [Candidatus Dojkabacteria bacterium]
MATSRSLNKVMLIGNLSRDPVIRTTPNGATVCTFGIATNTAWKDESGELQERTEFHNVVSWNKLAEICAQILSVGMLVYVEGEIRTRSWDDENGVRHYRSEVRVADMKLLDSKGKSGVGLDEARALGEKGGNAPREEKKEEKKAEKKEDKKEDESDNSEKKDEKEEVAPEDLPF